MKLTKLKALLTCVMLVMTAGLINAQGFKTLLPPCTTMAPTCNTVGLNSCEYVCNGGFESISSDVAGPSELPKANGWTSPVHGTPDLFTKTTTVSAVGIPCNGVGYQDVRSGGNAYAGIYTSGYNTGPYSEYIQTYLKDLLDPARLYEVSFWISRADFQPLDNQELDVFITSDQGSLYGPRCFGYNLTTLDAVNNYTWTLGQAPQPVYSVPTASLNDATNWTPIKFVYTPKALGLDNGLILGNYYGNSTLAVTSPTTVAGTSCSLTSAATSSTSPIYSYGPAYLYIDDVSLKDITPTLSFSPNDVCQNTAINFTMTPTSCFTPPSNYYIWNFGDGSATTAGNMNASHTYTAGGTYTVTVSYNIPSAIGQTHTHTTVVTVKNCCYNPSANNITLLNANLVPYGSYTAGISPTQWSSMSAGNTYTGNIEVPAPSAGTSVITNTLTVIGSFSVNANVTFSVCNISFNQDVAMKQYSTTVIDRSFLWGCDYLWTGIESRAYLEVKNSAIEDGYRAINVGYYSPSLANHPGLVVSNSIFNKCYVGIYVANTNISPSTNLRITGSVFTCRNESGFYSFAPGFKFNTITMSSPAKLKGSAASGIVANTIRTSWGVAFGSLTGWSGASDYFKVGDVDANTTTNADLRNIFNYLNNGVENYNTKIFVLNNKFENIINTGVGNARGAIVHDDLAGNSNTTITKVGDLGGGGGGIPTANYKNTFLTVLDGVNAFNGGSLDVSYNDFKSVSRYGVSVQAWNTASVSAEPVLVSNNSYSNTAYPFYGYNNTSISCTVIANTGTHAGSPDYTNYYATYIDEVSKSPGTYYLIKSNNFSGSLQGIYARNAKGIRVIDNTVTVKKTIQHKYFQW